MANQDLPVREKPLAIADYAIIGDCRTAALVGRDGAIDWLCLPRFDAPACFAALLGGSEHGSWLIAPQHAAPEVSRSYRDGTLVLETVFTTPDGEVALIDAMPLGSGGLSRHPSHRGPARARAYAASSEASIRLRRFDAMGYPGREWKWHRRHRGA